MAEFFANNAAKGGLQRFAAPPNVLPQSIVDEALIVPAAGLVHLAPKPVQNVVVEPDGDSGLALGNGHDRSALAAAEVVFTFHCFPRIAASARSRRPGGDEPNSLATPGVNHHQNSAQHVHPDRDPSLFISEMGVANGQGKIIFEDWDGICKVDLRALRDWSRPWPGPTQSARQPLYAQLYTPVKM